MKSQLRMSKSSVNLESKSYLSSTMDNQSYEKQIRYQKSQIIEMKKQNNEYNCQLINQKQPLKKQEILHLNQIKKLSEFCQVLAQQIEIENHRKEELQQVINSNKQSLENILSIDKSKNQSEEIQGRQNLQKVNQDLLSKDQYLQRLKQSHNEQGAQIEKIMTELNLRRRERVIHSTVINKIETDIKKKIKEYMKLVKENEISKVQHDILTTEYKNIIQFSVQEDQKIRDEFDKIHKLEQEEHQKILDTINERNQLISNKESEQQSFKEIDNENIDNKRVIQMKQNEIEVDKFENIFNQVLKLTKMNSIKDITDIYHVIQDANNELYEVVSSVNYEIERTEQEIKNLDKQIQSASLVMKRRFAQEKVQPLKRDQEISLQSCKQYLDKNKEALNDYRGDLLQLNEIIELPVNSVEITIWNLSGFAQTLIEKCQNLITVSELLKNPLYEEKNEKKLEFFVRTQSSINSELKESKSVKSSYQDKKINEILNSLQSQKYSEKIYNRQVFENIGTQEFKKKAQLKQNSKKSIIQ